MTLARLFQQYAASDVWAATALHTDLEAVLGRLHQDGQAAWPQLRLTPEQLVTFLARQLPPESATPEAVGALRVRDLYFLCAFVLRQRAADIVMQTEYLPKVRQALLQHGTPEALIADIQQDLCKRLIEQQDPKVGRRGYSGRGELAGWLCTVALREVGQRHKRRQREVGLDQSAAERLLDQHKDPEMDLLTGTLKQAFHEAFREALAALTSRERNLLRYHFLAGLSIDQIGDIYHVHRATAARWLTRTQEVLGTQTRERFLLRTQLSADSLPFIMDQIKSQLSVNLGNLLKSKAEHDPAEREAAAKRRPARDQEPPGSA